MDAPLYNYLVSRSNISPQLRFHIPGHKGLPGSLGILSAAASIDYTELSGTGNLYQPDSSSPISAAETAAAEAYGAASCVFLTGGGTQGVFTALASLSRPGDVVLIDRNSHASVFNALALLDLRPRFLYPKHISEFDIMGGILPYDIWEAVTESYGPRPRLILVTSPNYYGVEMDIAGLAETASGLGMPLVVDGAHGAHLPFLGRLSAVAQGADLEVISAHKTLPALGQAAMLLASARVQPGPLRHHASLFGTSSPSYLIMASIDLARAYMQNDGAREYARAAAMADAIREDINARGVFCALTDIDAGFSGGARVDSCRLTVCTLKGGIEGTSASKTLEEKYGIVPELADRANVVFVITGADSDDALTALGKALHELEAESAPAPRAFTDPSGSPPERVLSPREAMRADKRLVALSDALGLVAGQNIAPVPPGVPIVAAGERINAFHMTLFEQRCYNKDILVVNNIGEAEDDEADCSGGKP